MNSKLQRFIDRLLQAGLVTPEEIKQIRASLSVEEQSDELKGDQHVLRQLADSGHLTDFQISAVQQGKSDELVLDDYLLLDEIGRGGMGRVYKARHTLMQREVAVKFTLQENPDRDSDERFRREVQGLSKLVHPNIVSALDAGYRGKHCYLVMEFVEGTNLSTYIRKHGPMSFDEALGVIIQAAEGLKYVHRKQIVHRDVKPGNLLLTTDRVVKVLDVGLAKFEKRQVQEDLEQTERVLTQSGAIVGTVDYMSPEQALNSHAATPAADVYSLGCTLFYLLTGEPPFRQRDKSVLERVVAHREMAIPRLSKLVASAPTDFDHVFSKMLAKDPAQRYSDAGELLIDLRRVHRDQGSSVSGTTTVLANFVSPRRNRRVYFSIATCAGLLIIAGVLWPWLSADRISEHEQLTSTSIPDSTVTDPSASIDQPPLPLDLMQYIRLPANVLAGDGWRLNDGLLKVPSGGTSKLLIPVSTTQDYQLLGKVRRIQGTGPLVIMLPIRGTSQCLALIDSRRNDEPVSGFGFNAAGRLATTAPSLALSSEQPVAFRLEVRADGLSYFLNEQLVVRWEGDPADLRIAGGWSASSQPAFVVGSNHDSAFELSELRVEPFN
jgi:serine/threonine protein kinase